MVPALLVAALLGLGTRPQPAASASPFQTLFYSSEGLRLEAYLFKPDGAGPFPLVVYNHGSRNADARSERPVQYIARLLVPLGYAVLVPERRGYGKSEGPTLVEEVGADRAAKFVARIEAETRDVLAAVNYVTRSPEHRVDAQRMAMIGYSFGGMVTTLAMARDARFAAAIVQAPAAANWIDKPDVQTVLMRAAEQIRKPLHCTVAENDTQTFSTRAICAGAQTNGAAADVKIYPPFILPAAAGDGAVPAPGVMGPGHAIFSAAGVSIWQDDVVAFLAKYLKRS